MLSVHEFDRPPPGFLAAETRDARFYDAYQRAGIPGFRFGYLQIRRDGAPLATLPYFLTHFALNTMIRPGPLKSALAWIKLPVACVGHPAADVGAIEGDATADVLAAACEYLHGKAALIAFKGFGADLPLPAFVRARSLPNAVLDVPPDYYAQLTSDRRNQFKRKRRKAAALHVEEHDGLPEQFVEPVFGLYLNTLAEAPLTFERLTPDYFRHTAALSTYLLAFEGERLIGFVQLLRKGAKMSHTYIGMDYERGPAYGLYFLLFLRAIDACLRAGCTELDLGASSYYFKRRLGARLDDTYLYFRHRNPLAHWLLGKLRFLVEADEDDMK